MVTLSEDYLARLDKEVVLGEEDIIEENSDAVVLLSGGLDSTVCAYSAKASKLIKEVYALSFSYEQRHIVELTKAEKTVKKLGIVEHIVVRLPLTFLESSLLGKSPIPVTQGDSIPSTWVPQRNSIFLSIAFGFAESVGAKYIFIGTNSLDYSGYPDCRPGYLRKMEEALNLASKRFVETGYKTSLVAPLQFLSKAEIVKLGIELGVPFEDTWSCYRGGLIACGNCPSCELRLEAFKSVGIPDPLLYV